MIPDNILLTLCAHGALAVLFGCALFFMRMPAGILVGVFVAFAVTNCTLEPLTLPDTLRVVIQILAGSCVGCSLTRSDLFHIPSCKTTEHYAHIVFCYYAHRRCLYFCTNEL